MHKFRLLLILNTIQIVQYHLPIDVLFQSIHSSSSEVSIYKFYLLNYIHLFSNKVVSSMKYLTLHLQRPKIILILCGTRQLLKPFPSLTADHCQRDGSRPMDAFISVSNWRLIPIIPHASLSLVWKIGQSV